MGMHQVEHVRDPNVIAAFEAATVGVELDGHRLRPPQVSEKKVRRRRKNC